ncbi:MAG: DUF1287 domain-containing protein, partial [Oscillospiraceae bacterium]|nr:DUF1287 domain-containing protein [Oscillospiraceae bacterium]
VFAVLAAASALGYAMVYFNLYPQKYYSASDFGIETVKSNIDKDNDGIDDYTDILLSAREYLLTKPKYKCLFYEGGYPPDGEGMCTDVIWRAFEGAGYSLKEMIDADIDQNTGAYPGVNGRPNPDIDFRRIRNLYAFFKRNAISMPLDIDQTDQWQPGDIVVLNSHIAIISDKRDKNGVPFILHHAGQPVVEENALWRYEIVGHFRWPDIDL